MLGPQSVYYLEFCEIRPIEGSIVEIIIGEGVDLDMEKTHLLFNFFKNYSECQISLIINAQNSYSYSFEAQICFLHMPVISSVAFVVYDQCSHSGVMSLISSHEGFLPKIKIFSSKLSAIQWLRDKRIFKRKTYAQYNYIFNENITDKERIFEIFLH